MGIVLDLRVDGNSYRCYQWASQLQDDHELHYVVAGLGRVTIARSSGELVGIVPISKDAEALLEKLAPLIFEKAQSVPPT